MVLVAPVYILDAGQAELSLDGKWEIVFDDQNEGRSREWFLNDNFKALENRQKISVPIAWETIKKDYEGVAFYRKSFKVPADWKGKVVRMHFGAVNYIAEVWVNDEVVGYHEGGFTPFELRVDTMLKPGESNVVTLRVQGPIILSDKEVDGIGPLQTPQWRGGISGGIWQSVKLVATDAVYVDDVYLVPDWKDGSVSFDVELNNTDVVSKDAALKIEVRQAGAVISGTTFVSKDFTLRPGVTWNSWTVDVASHKLWSPDNPELYTAKVTVLLDGKASDLWEHRFGFREFTIKNKDFYLNGKRLYLKATFFEALYPNGIAYPDSEDMVRKEIRLAKEAGFNMIRPWRRPPAPMWLDIADEEGVLVVGSNVLECMRLPLSTPYLPERVEREIRESVLRDRNHTCVVQWELFNELHRPVLMQMMRPMALMVRELDSTRMILDESGGWAFGANMYLPDEYEPTKFNDIHNYAGPLINENQYDAYLTIGMTKEEKEAFGFKGNTPGRNVVPGLMSFVSELGYGSVPNLPLANKMFEDEGNSLLPAYRYHKRVQEEQEAVLQDSGFDYMFSDFEDFCLVQQSIHGAANSRMIEAVRSNPEVDGYCIHALTAGDWIFGAGLLDIWRNPKGAAYEKTKQANQPRIVTVRAMPRNVYADQGTQITVTGINDLDPVGIRLKVDLVAENGDTVKSWQLSDSMESGIGELLSEKIGTGSLQGNYTVRATVKNRAGKIITQNSTQLTVFQEAELESPEAKIAVLDMGNSLTPALDKLGVEFAQFNKSTDTSIPVFVTSIEAKNPQQKSRFEALEAFVKKGGTAVYISGCGRNENRTGTNYIRTEALPLPGQVEQAMGLWSCIPHLVKEHPIFDGLATGGPMRELYENVYARKTIRDIGGEAVVASIGFEWFSWNHEMHYSGPGESWWGADMAILPHGNGRYLISELRIVPNLNTDPVADKIFFNMIRFLSE